jgi:hypothetical protein
LRDGELANGTQPRASSGFQAIDLTGNPAARTLLPGGSAIMSARRDRSLFGTMLQNEFLCGGIWYYRTAPPTN